MSTPKSEEILLTSTTEVATAFDGNLIIGAQGMHEDGGHRRLGIAIGEIGYATDVVWLQVGGSHQYERRRHGPGQVSDLFYEIRVLQVPEPQAPQFTARILVTKLSDHRP
jgi:hypothetical protein